MADWARRMIGAFGSRHRWADLAQRSAVLEFGDAGVPGPARRTTAQGLDGQDDLVAGLKRSTRPPLPSHQAWRAAFQIPDARAAVRPLDLQQKIGVRTGVLELLHGAYEFNWVFLIEHGKGVVRHGSAAARDERTARDECGQLPSHSILPSDAYSMHTLRRWARRS